MTKYLVTKKGASAFGSAEGTFPVAPDGTVELPANGQLACELSLEGVIVAIPKSKIEDPKPDPAPVMSLPTKNRKKAA
jgi:hypothetical protein